VILKTVLIVIRVLYLKLILFSRSLNAETAQRYSFLDAAGFGEIHVANYFDSIDLGQYQLLC